jgi:uncharacterized protein (TIGR01777 family)
MKVLLTGATGFIGKHLAEHLFRERHELLILSRSGEKAARLFPFPVKALRWEARREAIPAEALAGTQAVIHLAGEGIADKRWSAARKKAIYDSRIEGTRKLVEAVTLHGPQVRCFLSTSAIGWYGSRADEILDEKSSGGEGFLSEVCRDWERETENLPAHSRCCRVRIGVALGKDGGALKRLLPLFRLGLGGRVGHGRQWMSWIHVDDLAALFAFLLESDKAAGAINATAPNPVTNREFSRTLGKVLKRPAFLPAPAFALKAALGELSQIVLDGQRVLPRRAADLGFKFQYGDLIAALTSLLRPVGQSFDG